MKRLATTLIIGLTLVTAQMASAHEFEDIPPENRYHDAVQMLLNSGLVDENRFFYPDRRVNFGSLVRQLVYFTSPTKCDPKGPMFVAFKDQLYGDCLQKAFELGILQKTPSEIYWGDPIETHRAFELIFQFYGLPIPRVYHGDEGNIPGYLSGNPHLPLYMEVIEGGLMSQDEFEPLVLNKDGLTRGQVAQLIYDTNESIVRLSSSKNPDSINNVTPSLDPDIAKIQRMLRLIDNEFYGEDFTREELIDGALLGMSRALNDSYSTYMDVEQTENFKDSLTQKFFGIGAYIEPSKPDNPEETYIIIISIIEGSPAEAVGLKAGDVIMAVDGLDIKGFSTLEAANLIKGPDGSMVNLLIQRNDQELSIDITRGEVVIVSLEHDIQNIDSRKIMYIKLNSFGRKTFTEFQERVDTMRNENVKGLVIDLRNNPGGLLDSVVDILSLFVPKDQIITAIKKEESSSDILSEGIDDISGEFPVVLLVNERSASASEIMAGVLQEYELATLVGVTTFGKGSVQRLYSFDDDSSFKLTIAHYLIGEKEIHGIGITPDIVAEVSEDEPENDPQLERALEELSKMF